MDKEDVLTVGELKGILEYYDDDIPVEIGAFIFPSEIIKEIDNIKRFKAQITKESGSEHALYCFQTEHVGVDVHYEPKRLVITGKIEIEQLEAHND